MEFEFCIWNLNFKLQFWIGIWNCNLELEFGIAIWNLNLEFGIGIWNLELKLEIWNKSGHYVLSATAKGSPCTSIRPILYVDTVPTNKSTTIFVCFKPSTPPFFSSSIFTHFLNMKLK